MFVTPSGVSTPPRAARSVAGCPNNAPRTSAQPRIRLAIITPWHPAPVDNGSKHRIRQMIAALADDFDIVLISLLTSDENRGAQVPSVAGVYQQHVLPLPAYRANSLRAILAGFTPLPRSFVATWDQTVAAAVARIIREEGVALAIGADLRVLRYLLALPRSLICLLDEANTSIFIAPTGQRFDIASLRARARARKYASLLRESARVLSGVIVSSQQEARAYRQLANTDRVMVIENSVGNVPPVPWQPPTGAQLLYNGALGYAPNADAVDYFADEILPTVAAAVPEVQLVVTGAIPATLPPASTNRRITLTGWLDEDTLDTVYRDSRVCVVPLRMGTGTRIKLLDALAYGIPIVTTTKGAEGLDVTPGEHLLIADTPADFAAATLRLLRDNGLAARLGARGREHVIRRYSLDARAAELRALLGACLSQRKVEGC